MIGAITSVKLWWFRLAWDWNTPVAPPKKKTSWRWEYKQIGYFWIFFLLNSWYELYRRVHGRAEINLWHHSTYWSFCPANLFRDILVRRTLLFARSLLCCEEKRLGSHWEHSTVKRDTQWSVPHGSTCLKNIWFSMKRGRAQKCTNFDPPVIRTCLSPLLRRNSSLIRIFRGMKEQSINPVRGMKELMLLSKSFRPS